MTALRQDSLAEISPDVAVPGYDRRAVSVGVVHLGPGAFHRAHLAMYLDSYLATGDRSWGICTVGLLPGDAAIRDVLRAQDNLYTLITVDPDGTEQARVVGSIVRHLHAPDDREAVLDQMTDPGTRIVSLTITEGGYDADATTDAFDVIVEALARRRAAGIRPFTVLSCDNLQANGAAARRATLRAAAGRDPALAEWITTRVDFPSSMVDRITPVTTDATREAAHARGLDDAWPVRAESFAQWVVEDRFGDGRPELERVGVQVVPDVAPYEKLKLRLLNASHQAIAYLGLLTGVEYVHEVCRDPLSVRFLRAYMRQEAIPTLDPVPGIDVDDYCDQLLNRFASDAIQDTLARQAVDSPHKIRTYLLPVVSDRLRAGGEFTRCALVLAAWASYLAGERHADSESSLGGLAAAAAEDIATPGRLLEYAPVFGEIGKNPILRTAYLEACNALRALGPRGAMAALVQAP